MNQKELNQFFSKLATNCASDKDLADFRRHLAAAPSQEAHELLKQYAAIVNTSAPVDQERLSRISQAIERAIDREADKSDTKHKLWPVFLRIAACLLLVASAATFWYLRHPAHTNSPVLTKDSTPIEPGKDQAVLILADGSKIALNNDKDTTLEAKAMPSGFEQHHGLLHYAPAASHKAEKQLHTLEVPRGGQYQLLLPDGTKVWLNASTTLSFPSAFESDKREIFLEGEAYLEVAPDKMAPFIVKTKDGVVNVLGTKFNVRAYSNEASVTTTLLDGSVKVSNGNESKLLKPGEEANWTEKQAIRVQPVETMYAVAWKSGFFMFNRLPIDDVMAQLARWYDIDVIYSDEKPTNTIWGSISRFDRFDDVLKTLEELGSVTFKTEGRKVYVRKTADL